MMTECPVIFPDGIGVLPWMVPGQKEIAVATSKKMKDYNAVVWAHHGIFVSGTTFDEAFGLCHTIEKSAEIAVKVRSVSHSKLQTITRPMLRELAAAFKIKLAEIFMR
jgi:rhamnulose-1-phosphate aldolase